MRLGCWPKSGGGVFGCTPPGVAYWMRLPLAPGVFCNSSLLSSLEGAFFTWSDGCVGGCACVGACAGAAGAPVAGVVAGVLAPVCVLEEDCCGPPGAWPSGATEDEYATCVALSDGAGTATAVGIAGRLVSGASSKRASRCCASRGATVDIKKHKATRKNVLRKRRVLTEMWFYSNGPSYKTQPRAH